MEFLKDLLKTETYEALKAELEGKDVKIVNLKSGDYVSKAKANDELDKAVKAEQKKLTKLQTEYDALNSKLQEANGRITGYEQEHNEYVGYKQTTEAETENLRNDLKLAHIGRVVDKAKPKDADIVMQQLNIEDIAYEDGKLTGLDEQLATLQENKPFLFGTDKNKRGGLDHDNEHHGDDEMDKYRGAMGL